jgi:pimeloyl-ACP methyl ester carboxylesterase
MANEYVLVHGACHGAWCWDGVAARLRAKGHRVVTLDLPGHGRRAAEARRASVEAYGHAVANAMALEGISRGVVVGHSMGGLVIPKAAELAPARVAHLVFLAAVVVPDGGSLAGTLMTSAGRAMMTWARWMGDMPRSDPRVSSAISLLTPQALRPFVEAVDLRVFYGMRVPRTYIRCLQDKAVVPARAAERAALLGVNPVDMDCAHDAMLSQPAELARILEKI